MTFTVAILIGERAGWVDRFSDLSIIGLLALMILLYSQRLLERSHV